MDKFKGDGDSRGKEGMQQKLMARKREVRQKKADSRGN